MLSDSWHPVIAALILGGVLIIFTLGKSPVFRVDRAGASIIGAVALIALYLIMIIRIVMIASKMPAFFGSLLVLSLGIMIFVQLSVNIAVAVNLIPVTGQPLPLISYGGTSMLVTYFQLGIILNISSRIQVYDEEGMGKKQDIEEINDIA